MKYRITTRQTKRQRRQWRRTALWMMLAGHADTAAHFRRKARNG